MGTVTSEQRALISVIRSLFGNGPFDTTSVAGKTYDHMELVAAIEAVLPGRQWWKKHGGIVLDSHSALRRLLTRQAALRHQSVRWWCIVEAEATGGADGQQSGQFFGNSTR